MYTDEEIELFYAIAEGKVLQKPLPQDAARARYKSLYLHPLPMSLGRFQHEELLKRILVCPLDKQVLAAITLNDAWCLEECYLRGADVNVIDRCGVTPLHVAAQLDRFDCCMVLINIGVDANASQLDGMTPLGLAVASKSITSARYLRGIGAKESVPVISSSYTAASTVLESASLPRLSISASALSDFNRLPHHHKHY
jgi:ankyrin repeat protein